jgi:hypothetical protein
MSAEELGARLGAMPIAVQLELLAELTKRVRMRGHDPSFERLRDELLASLEKRDTAGEPAE